MKLKNITIMGATGQIGRLILDYMQKRSFPVADLNLLDIAPKDGSSLKYNKKDYKIQNISDFNFSNTDLVIFSRPYEGYVADMLKAAEMGAVVVDGPNHFRGDPKIPQIIPEINAGEIVKYKNKNIICGSNCAAIQMLMALKPLHDHKKIKRVVVSTYHSASGIGHKARQELKHSAQANLDNVEYTPEVFPRNLAFNVIPQAENFLEDGRTNGEWKMEHDTNRILCNEITVTATCVRVPVDIGHSESVNVEFTAPLTAEEAKEIINKAPGVTLMADNEDYITPAQIAGSDDVYVSRIRKDSSTDNALNFWVVADNLRKGAALNIVQIAELWVHHVNDPDAEIPGACAQ